MLQEILKAAVKYQASDIHIKVGSLPIIRQQGQLIPIRFGEESRPLSAEQVDKLAFSVMNEKQRQVFLEKSQLDLSFGVSNLGRFRLNIFKQRGSTRIVIRILPVEVPQLDELNLPPVVKDLATADRGLILVTGATGVGKSTSLAGMINHINTHMSKHIITIEDPIEFLIPDNKSLITQRELGSDAISFHEALRSSLRQDPDVILVGEMRDRETMETALWAASTGHLVLSTLHTLDTTETVNRIVGSFPVEQQQQVRLQLGSTLKAIISQRLIPKSDNKGFVPSVEILINTARVREMIENPEKTSLIPRAIEEGHTVYQMQTFDNSLMGLVLDKKISYNEALRYATSPEDFAIKYSGLISSTLGEDKKWEEKTEYKEHVSDKWENMTTVELESIPETVTRELSPDVRIHKRSSGDNPAMKKKILKRRKE